MLRRRELVVVALAFLLTLPAVTSRFYASDEIQFFSWLHSWTFDGDADFENEYRHFYDNGTVHYEGFRQTFLEDVNEAGRRFNFAPIGSAVLWLPFYGAGHLAAGLTGAPQDGYSRPYITSVAVGSALYGTCALLLSVALARQLTGTGAAASLWIFAGTPIAFYMYVAPGFSHACSAFAVALFLWTWLRVRTDWTPTGAACLGLAGALMAMVREQDVFFLAAPAIDFTWQAWRRRDTLSPAGRVPAALAGLLACAAAYAPQLIAYQALNGHPTQTTAVARKMNWASPHFLQVLGSPENGFFVWTPLALVAVAGLIAFAGRVGRASQAPVAAAPVPALLVLVFLLQVYVSGAVDSWSVAGSFGQRRFIATTPLLIIGLAWWQTRTRTARSIWLRRGLLVLCVWWHVGLMAQFALHVMDRQRLTPGANAYWTFVTLPPRLPQLMWRYAFDRPSFYDLRRD